MIAYKPQTIKARCSKKGHRIRVDWTQGHQNTHEWKFFFFLFDFMEIPYSSWCSSTTLARWGWKKKWENGDIYIFLSFRRAFFLVAFVTRRCFPSFPPQCRVTMNPWRAPSNSRPELLEFFTLPTRTWDCIAPLRLRNQTFFLWAGVECRICSIVQNWISCDAWQNEIIFLILLKELIVEVFLKLSINALKRWT